MVLLITYLDVNLKSCLNKGLSQLLLHQAIFNILVLGGGPSQGLHNTATTSGAKYSTKITV